MKKILVVLVGVLLLIGGGCAKSAPATTLENQEQKQVEYKTYTNSKWKFAFTYASSTMHVTEIDEDNISVSYVRPEDREGGYAPSLSIEAIKVTVYPEHKIEQLKNEYFKGVKNLKVAQIDAGVSSGWEITNVNYGGIGEVYQVLYFPNGSKELLFIDTENAFGDLLKTLQFTK